MQIVFLLIQAVVFRKELFLLLRLVHYLEFRYLQLEAFFGSFKIILISMWKYFLSVLFLFPFIAEGQIITTFAGNGISGNTGDGGPATTAKILNPAWGVFDGKGNFYFSQQAFGSVRKVDSAGVITTIAGPGTFGVLGDGGLATAASFDLPDGLAFDTAGNLYIADNNHFRVRKIDMVTGIISTYAGSGISGSSGDSGAATAAKLSPADIHFDKHGNLFISDNTYNKIRIVNSLGIIYTYAGTGVAGFSGDGGAAATAQLHNPVGFAIDDNGNLFFADVRNHRVRKIDTFGIITTAAGTGIGAYLGDGIPATDAQFGPYAGLAIDNDNNVYVDDSNQRIRVIDPTGIIHTVTGTGIAGYNGDGILADTAEIYDPGGIAIDACGSVYFSDPGNNRIRKIALPPILAVPTISLSSAPTASAGATVTITATVANAGSSYTIYWMNHGVEFTTTTAPYVTYTKGLGIDTITAKIVPTGYGCWDSTTSAGHVVGLPEGVSALTAAAELLIFPNPVNSTLNIIMYGAPVTVAAISDVVGHVVMSETFNTNKVHIDVASLPQGMYFVRVNGIYVQKFIKQ